MQQILLNFVFMHTAVQKFQFFVFICIAKIYAIIYAKIYAKIYAITYAKIYAIIRKKFWLKFHNHAKFRAVKSFILKECAILCKTGFVLIQKWCGISCKTTQLLRKRIDCFVETLVEPWRILYRRLYGGGLEALWGRTLPQKVKWGSEAVPGMLPSLPRVTLYI